MLDIGKATVIVGQRGVITLPAKMREQLGIQQGDALKVIMLNGILQIELIGEKKDDN